ncbi:hypothetical protein U9M48_005985, partial [Paspalum notatum var. saurae]
TVAHPNPNFPIHLSQHGNTPTPRLAALGRHWPRRRAEHYVPLYLLSPLPSLWYALCPSLPCPVRESARKKAMENDKAKDRSASNGFDPWNPPCEPRPAKPADLDIDSYFKLVTEWSKRRNTIIATSRATHVFIPDRTPQRANTAFYDVCDLVFPILEKDNVPRLLRYLKEDGRGMCWNLVITSETLNQMVVFNALRCAKVVLEGQAVELSPHRANPNCMNQYGYFPLHEAAERFSVEMIKLLLNHGALTNLRTSGHLVVEGLLPLHVAVENTCMHKYLEDNLFPNVDHPDYPNKVDDNYIYKLIHLLCLPEMKIFLDTTRLLAGKTENLLDEIWNYVKDGKVVQAAVLLMAAQKHIRGRSSCKTNGDDKLDGFTTIINRIHHSMNLELSMCQNEEKPQQLHLKIKVMLSSLLLVNIIFQTGATIEKYIRDHREASHVEVLGQVSSILKSYGFNPTGEDIDIKNLCPYKFRMRNEELFDKYDSLLEVKATTGVPDVLAVAAGKKDVGNKLTKRYKHKYTWLSFFPYWRSVLASRFPVKVYPGQARVDTKRVLNLWDLGRSQSYSTDKVSPIPNGIGVLGRISQPGRSRSYSTDKVSPIPNAIGVLGRISQPGNYQPRRHFGIALSILKVLRKA